MSFILKSYDFKTLCLKTDCINNSGLKKWMVKEKTLPKHTRI